MPIQIEKGLYCVVEGETEPVLITKVMPATVLVQKADRDRRVSKLKVTCLGVNPKISKRKLEEKDNVRKERKPGTFRRR